MITEMKSEEKFDAVTESNGDYTSSIHPEYDIMKLDEEFTKIFNNSSLTSYEDFSVCGNSENERNTSQAGNIQAGDGEQPYVSDQCWMSALGPVIEDIYLAATANIVPSSAAGRNEKQREITRVKPAVPVTSYKRREISVVKPAIPVNAAMNEHKIQSGTMVTSKWRRISALPLLRNWTGAAPAHGQE
jgi:hypothetical protein